MQTLLKRKPFFKSDIEKGELGSPPLTELLKKLKPKRWFSAHLHVKFEATYSHTGAQSDGAVNEANPDEIAIDDFDEFDEPPPAADTMSAVAPPSEFVAGATETLFMALDKCLPRRQYLEVVEVPTVNDIDTSGLEPSSSSTVVGLPSSGTEQLPSDTLTSRSEEPASAPTVPLTDNEIQVDSKDQVEEDPKSELVAAFLPTSFGKQKQSKPEPGKTQPPRPPSPQRSAPEFTYDLEWLAISRALHPYLSLQRAEIRLPSESQIKELVKKEMVWVMEHIGVGKRISDVQKFVLTAPGPSGGGNTGRGNQNVPCEYCFFCSALPLEDWPNACGSHFLRATGVSPVMWYTNPQTEAFCEMIGVDNKVNPVPTSGS